MSDVEHQQQQDHPASTVLPSPPTPLDDNDVGLSLPSVEEYKTQHADILTAHDRFKQQKFTLSALACLCLLPLLIGLAVGVNRGKTEEQFLGEQDNVKNAHRLAKVVDFLAQGDLVLKHELETEGSLQNTGAKWISDFDDLQLPIPKYADDPVGYNVLQRYALVLFYMALGGEQWESRLGFMTSKPTCEWNLAVNTNIGNQEQFNLGVTCNPGGQVEEIFLPGNKLVGTLPDEIGLLTSLTKFSVFDNDIAGQLPASMAKLVQMDFLALDENDLEGPLPTWLGSLTKLRYLAASGNLFSGPVPASLAGARDLVEIALDNNDLRGDVKVFNSLPNLRRLYIGENYFEDDITDSFLGGLELVELDISGNLFGGSIPKKWFNLNRMEVLDIHNNQIGGRLPEEIDPNDAMVFLAVHQNDLGSTIPSSITNLKYLQHLDLSQNMFDGTLPGFFNQLTHLKYLFVGNNDFDNSTLPDFTGMEDLEELSLKRCNLDGSIPDSIAKLQNLVLLDLDNNSLDGGIPHELGTLTNLQYLLLNRNEFHGHIPTSFRDLQNLHLLMLDNNTHISGGAVHICSHWPKNLEYFISDCGDTDGTLTCSCCTECCEKSKPNCNSGELLANLNPTNANSYKRGQYVFSNDIVFNMSD